MPRVKRVRALPEPRPQVNLAQDHVGPGLYPLFTLFTYFLCTDPDRLRWDFGKFKGIRRSGVFVHRVHKHLVREIFLESGPKGEVDELLREGLAVCALENSYALDLGEGGIIDEDVSSRWRFDRLLGEENSAAGLVA